jgi:hypothetical protein
VFAIAQSTTEKTGYNYGDPHEPGKLAGLVPEGGLIPQKSVVILRVTPFQEPFCEDNFTVSFFIPFAVQVGQLRVWKGRGL